MGIGCIGIVLDSPYLIPVQLEVLCPNIFAWIEQAPMRAVEEGLRTSGLIAEPTGVEAILIFVGALWRLTSQRRVLNPHQAPTFRSMFGQIRLVQKAERA